MADSLDTDLIGLETLPVPDVVESLDFEELLRLGRAVLARLDPASAEALRETDPAMKLLEVDTYRELAVRARVNDAVRGCLLAFASESTMAHLAAWVGIPRKVLDPGNPEAGVPPVLEDLEVWRRRIAMGSRTWSVAGPRTAYEQLALQATDAVADSFATKSAPGSVSVYVLGPEGAAVSPADIAVVQEYLSADERRPITDLVTVQAGAVYPSEFTATVYVPGGPATTATLADAVERFKAYAIANRRLAVRVPKSGLVAALMAPGVQRVESAVTDELLPWIYNPGYAPGILEHADTQILAVEAGGSPYVIYQGGT